jgi:hypothetical protein
MPDGAAEPARGWGIPQGIQAVQAVVDAIAAGLDAVETWFSPIKIFRFSFGVAAWLCLFYSIALPTRFYFTTHEVLLSDVSIYYLLGAIGMFLTERALKDFEERSENGRSESD